MNENDLDDIIDWELALQQANGKHSLAVEMIKMLINCLPEHEAALEEAYQKDDFEEMHIEIHKLYGALCYTGTPRLKKAAKELENIILTKHKNNINKTYQHLKIEIASLKKAYQQMDLK